MQYVWIPKGISIHETIEGWSYNMKRHSKLANMNFSQAILRDKSKDKDGNDYVKATVHLPQWIRKEIAIQSIDENISEGKIYTSIVDHGTAILQEQFGGTIDGLRGVRRKLLGTDNKLINSIVQDFTISVNGVEGGARRTIYISVWCKDYLGRVGSTLRMDFSSLIRLAMYISISSCQNLSEKDMALCKDELEQFKDRLNEYSLVCGQLLHLV